MKIHEQNFIEQLYKKNEQALTYLLDHYGGLVKGVVIKHIGYSANASDIEECINDVFFAIWSHIGSFDATRSTFANWVGGIARYKSIDYCRKLILRQKHGELTQELYYMDMNLEDVESRELSEELEALLSCLKPKDKDIFIKLFYEDKPVPVVSQETGLKQNTIYARLSRGRKKIKKQALAYGERSKS